jgi:sporulation protein YlmC with PRC-barrel domain
VRLSELLGADVVDAAGEPVGRVTDVRLAQTGPVGTGVLARFVVESLLVSPHHTGSLFGYERRHDQGPALLRAVVRWLHRRAVMVRWADVEEWDVGARRVTLGRDHDRHPPEVA